MVSQYFKVAAKKNFTALGCLIASNLLEGNLVIYTRSHFKNSYPFFFKFISFDSKTSFKKK